MIIKKLVNGNVSFIDADANYERVIQQTGVQLEKTLDEIGVIIHQVGYPDLYIKTADVTAYQILPAGSVAFAGTTADLFLIIATLFAIPTGTGSATGVTYDNTGTDLAATTVQDAITELATEWTEVEVDVTSLQILSMGTVPVSLLAAAGANSYYNFDSIIVEYNAGATAYTYPSAAAKLKIIGLNSTYMISYIGSGLSDEIAISRGQVAEDLDTATPFSYPELKNNTLLLTTATGTDWTLGDGTLKVKIKYKIATFG